MRTIAVLLLMLVSFSSLGAAARAEQSSDCLKCRDQQRACMANYSGKTCKTEYEICMKSCQRK
jgi:hypothetical protein